MARRHKGRLHAPCRHTLTSSGFATLEGRTLACSGFATLEGRTLACSGVAALEGRTLACSGFASQEGHTVWRWTARFLQGRPLATRSDASHVAGHHHAADTVNRAARGVQLLDADGVQQFLCSASMCWNLPPGLTCRTLHAPQTRQAAPANIIKIALAAIVRLRAAVQPHNSLHTQCSH